MRGVVTLLHTCFTTSIIVFATAYSYYLLVQLLILDLSELRGTFDWDSFEIIPSLLLVKIPPRSWHDLISIRFIGTFTFFIKDFVA